MSSGWHGFLCKGCSNFCHFYCLYVIPSFPVTTSTSSVIFSCLAVMFRFFVLKYCLDILRSLGLGEVLHLLKFLTIKYFPSHSLLSPWVSKKVVLNSWVLCFHHKLQVCMILIARYSNLLPLFSAVLILFMSHPKAFFITNFPF